MPEPGILLIEGSDFETFPVGGQLTMVRCLMKLFGPRLSLVGMTKRDEPVGQWIEKKIDGVSYSFFSVHRRQPGARKPLVPVRFTFYRALRRYRREILDKGCRNAFVQGQETLLAVARWEWDSLCFDFPGVENPLSLSRYWYGRYLASLFEKRLFAALDHVDVVLATADQAAIGRMVARSKGRVSIERVTQLPTCVDTFLFRPVDPRKVRPQLGIPQEATVFVNAGRIGRFKGWELLIDSFARFQRDHPASLLLFVGDGEDREALLAHARTRNVASSVRITGFLAQDGVADHLKAADAVLFGSVAEGWCTSMLEALACGKPLVSTAVSGADELIRPGGNGYIVHSRDPEHYRAAMERALALPNARQISLQIATKFDLPHMRERLSRHWPPFRGAASASDQAASESGEHATPVRFSD